MRHLIYFKNTLLLFESLFIKDVIVYQKLTDRRMRRKIGMMIYKRYCFIEKKHKTQPLPDSRHSVLENLVAHRVTSSLKLT